MAYPENVGIKAIEIYVPNQVCTLLGLPPLVYPCYSFVPGTDGVLLLRPWIKRFLRNTKVSRPANIPLAWA